MHVTTKFKSDNQFESVVFRIVGIEKLHSVKAVVNGFGRRNCRGTVGHHGMVFVQGAPKVSLHYCGTEKNDAW